MSLQVDYRFSVVPKQGVNMTGPVRRVRFYQMLQQGQRQGTLGDPSLCDQAYGRRVAEGIQNLSHSSASGGPIGSANAGDAVQDAQQNSHEARPY
jgi:hypothetical protein